MCIPKRCFSKVEVDLNNTGTIIASSETYKKITGLSAGVHYFIDVQVVTTKGSSPFSAVINTRTKPMEQTELDKFSNSLGLPALKGRSIYLNSTKKKTYITLFQSTVSKMN